MIRRATIIVSGTVQEAGYRETVHRMAFDLHLRGQARNLDDGTVEMICEGDLSSLRNLVRRIRIRQFPFEVESVRSRYSAPTGEFRKFTVIKDTRLDGDVSAKMEKGFGLIKDMHQDLVGAFRGVGSEVRQVGKEVRQVGSGIKTMDGHIQRMDGSIKRMDSHVKTMDGHIQRMDGSIKRMDSHVKTMDGHIERMDSNMGNRFDRLDNKYDKFGKTLKGAARDIRAMGSDTRAMKGDIHHVRKSLAGPRRRKTS